MHDEATGRPSFRQNWSIYDTIATKGRQMRRPSAAGNQLMIDWEAPLRVQLLFNATKI